MTNTVFHTYTTKPIWEQENSTSYCANDENIPSNTDTIFTQQIQLSNYEILIANEIIILPITTTQIDSLVNEGVDTTIQEIIYTDSNGCDSIVLIDYQIISSTNNSFESAVNLFPNPVQDQLFIQFDEAIQGAFQIDIFNTIGQKIEAIHPYENGAKQLMLSTSQLPQGVYYLYVGINQERYRFKFFKTD